MRDEATPEPVDGLRAGETRLHLSLPTHDLERALTFYRALLDVEPSKHRHDYAKLEPDAPRVNLSLLATREDLARASGSPRHFGLQLDSAEAVERVVRRMREAGLAGRAEQGTTCCYAVQDKVWFTDPDGNAWEVYVVLADADRRSPDVGDCRVDASAGAGETRGACC